MLFLTFQLGQDRYAIEASRVIEVLPLLALKRLPQAPRFVVGIFNLRGRPVPAIDLNELGFGKPSGERLTTRIIVVRHKDSAGGDQLLGLIAEYVTQTIHKDRGEFMNSGVAVRDAPYLGPVLMDAQGPIQLLHTENLVSEPIRQLLFPDRAAGSVS